jgi:hypothetical protein
VKPDSIPAYLYMQSEGPVFPQVSDKKLKNWSRGTKEYSSNLLSYIKNHTMDIVEIKN